ncbi:MAG TPA: hypothetical protein DDY78_14915 [Planctomycetales bacterium]|jgi:hypothetical protein|nr:hypothetical protein [Planctomycetales bacterium]
MGGPDGAVEWWGDPLTDAEVIGRLQNEDDVVVRGPSWRGNRDEARRVTVLAFGGCEEDSPHGGPMSLPHFHPDGRFPKSTYFLTRFPRRMLGNGNRQNRRRG